MDSLTSSIETGTDAAVWIHKAELRSKGEDRSVVLHFEHGTIIAIFDGHCGSQLSDFAANTLPAQLAERLREDVDVAAVMRDTIAEFDRSLLSPVLALFEEGEDFSDAKWLDAASEIYLRFGYPSVDDERYKAGMRATVGSTALIAFFDRQRTHLWVASLGDCDAVCGRKEAGNWTALFLSERHNCSNPDEVQRLRQEHPNEDHVIQMDDALLGTLRVTRALGDHQLKAPLFMATRLWPHFDPPRLEAEEILGWSVWTPPYILSTPVIRRHEVLPGDMFLFASDGLRDVLRLPDAEKFNAIVSLANGAHDLALGYECIPAQDGDNVAQRVIENVLFGTDERKRGRELDKRTYRDDISLVVVSVAA